MSKAPTDHDTKFLATILLKSKITSMETNWEAVTQAMGYKNIRSTKTRFSQVMKKHADKAAEGPEILTTPRKVDDSFRVTKKSGGGRKAKAASKQEEEGDDSPSKGKGIKMEPKEEATDEENMVLEDYEEEEDLAN